MTANFGARGRLPANFQRTAPCRIRPSLEFSGDGRKLAISTLVVIGEGSRNYRLRLSVQSHRGLIAKELWVLRLS